MSRLGPLEVRVITATITITTSVRRRTEDYRLITTVLDPDSSPLDIVTLTTSDGRSRPRSSSSSPPAWAGRCCAHAPQPE
jgi:hypothetical protein